MKKRVISAILCLCMAGTMLIGCGGKADTGEEKKSTEQTEDKGKMQVKIAANPLSGQVLDAIATDRGFYADEGLEVEVVYCNANEDAFTALTAGEADLVSTYGTCMPLQYIGEGEDLTIFGGYMLDGAMTLIAREDTEYNGIEDLVGKKIAGNISDYNYSWPLKEAGYDPFEDVEWVEISEHQDRLQAVAKGEADFMVGTTGISYNAEQMGLKVVAYASDLMPDYSCCRAACRTEWLEENPEAAEALMVAWIRALNVLTNEREYAIDLMVDTLDLDYEYCANYMNDDRWVINVDPDLYAVSRAWYVMGELGLLGDNSSLETLQAHFDSETYKAALDTCVEKYRDEDPEFYDYYTEFYDANNRLYEAYE